MTPPLQPGDRIRVRATCKRLRLRGKRSVIRAVDSSKGKRYWVYLYLETEYWFRADELEKV